MLIWNAQHRTTYSRGYLTIGTTEYRTRKNPPKHLNCRRGKGIPDLQYISIIELVLQLLPRSNSPGSLASIDWLTDRHTAMFLFVITNIAERGLFKEVRRTFRSSSMRCCSCRGRKVSTIMIISRRYSFDGQEHRFFFIYLYDHRNWNWNTWCDHIWWRFDLSIINPLGHDSRSGRDTHLWSSGFNVIGKRKETNEGWGKL